MKPLYFYHLVDKNIDLSNGLISLKYMYDHNLDELFNKNASKYFDRITNYWNIPKYKNKKYLTKEEYLDALNIYRGDNGSNYIYFFKYAPKEELGTHMASILKNKDIYRINLNDTELSLYIDNIFYGYKDSHSDNEILTKEYYETVTEEEYFKNYNDSSKMNYASLNHIGISFKDGYCPKKFLTKIN